VIPFAVSVKELHGDGQASWVLAVSETAILIVHEDKSLHWHPIEDCTFARLMAPDQPQPVVAVQPVRKGIMPVPGRLNGA